MAGWFQSSTLQSKRPQRLLRKVPDDRLAVAAAARVLDDEEILKVEASPREEGGEVVEVEREAHGALGALGFGIGTSEIEHILATQTLVYRLAKTMLIRIDGELPEGSTAKDLALTVLRTISARGALGHVVEYQGSAVDALSIEGRMTLCNLTVEAGARGARREDDCVGRGPCARSCGRGA